MSDYYKAYEERYKQVYENNELWETKKETKELINIINKLNITKNNTILDIGCGEGRDAINLLNSGYNVYAIDYSKSAIDKCNEITNYKYKEYFRDFDIIKDNLDKKYDFIYSIAVLHMFVLDSDRNRFWKFIDRHLNKYGYAVVMCMGNGIDEYESNINDAFKLKKKININTNKEMLVASTSCRIVSWNTLEKEIKNNNLEIVAKYISTDIPNFDKVMCVIVKKCDIISHG